jgi:sulfite oxidase
LIDPTAWRLHVHGLVERELDLSLTTLREAFRERQVAATLECAGNRRKGLIAIRDIPAEAPWGPGATGTATWSGVALADVLALAGPLPDAAHVGFEGADLCAEAHAPERFGGSIPLEKACRSEVLLAWAMNGQALPPVHGAPLRVLVPGYIGARSVKWLERIEVRATPSRGYFQHVAYRLLPEDGRSAASYGDGARGEGESHTHTLTRSGPTGGGHATTSALLGWFSRLRGPSGGGVGRGRPAAGRSCSGRPST